eukprot:gene9800-13183_t
MLIIYVLYFAIGMDTLYSYHFHLNDNQKYKAVRTRQNHLNPNINSYINSNNNEIDLENFERLLNAPPSYISKLVNKKRELSVTDVSVLGGVSLEQARKDLTQFAEVTDATLKVTQDGDIIYAFPDDYEVILTRKSLTQNLFRFYRQVYPAINYSFRISFGIVLITSIVLIAVSIVALAASSSSSDDDRKRSSSSRASSINFNSLFALDDLRVLSYNGGYPKKIKGSLDMNMLESIFSYLVGDEDPNKNYNNDLFKKLTSEIIKQQGIMTAEEIALYLPDVPNIPDESHPIVDESFVLPVLSKLNGYPFVSPNGDIYYKFDELYDPKTLLSMNNNNALLLKETKQFSKAGKDQLSSAFLLGVANFGGIIALGNSLASYTARAGISGVATPVILQIVSRLYPFLWAYAFLYNVIPLVRYGILKNENAKIETSNEVRKKWYDIVFRNRPNKLKEKLENKKLLQIDNEMKKSVFDKSIIYDSSKSLDENVINNIDN